jgi:hypothetical protein
MDPLSLVTNNYSLSVPKLTAAMKRMAVSKEAPGTPSELSDANRGFISNVKMTGIFGIGFLLGLLSLAIFYETEFSSPISLKPTTLKQVDPLPTFVNTSHGVVVRKHVQGTNFVDPKDLISKNQTKKATPGKCS